MTAITSNGNFSVCQGDKAKSMALFYTAAAAGGLWYLTAYGSNLQKLARRRAADGMLSGKDDEPPPDQGRYMPGSQMTFANTRGRFVSAIETRDIQGAPIFLVDYGTGAKTIQYVDPRIVL